MKIYWIALAATFALCACSAFENFQRVGTYEYEGEKFDVYAADDVEHNDGETNASYYVLIPEGQRPHHLNVVASCSLSLTVGFSADALKACETDFGSQLRESREPAAPRDEGGMY